MTTLLDALANRLSGPSPTAAPLVAAGPPFDTVLLDASAPSDVPSSTTSGPPSQDGAPPAEEAPTLDARAELANDAPAGQTALDEPVMLVAGPLAAPSLRRTDDASSPVGTAPHAEPESSSAEDASPSRPASMTTTVPTRPTSDALSLAAGSFPALPSSDTLRPEEATPGVPASEPRLGTRTSGDSTALDRPVSPLQSPPDLRPTPSNAAPRSTTDTPPTHVAHQAQADSGAEADAQTPEPARATLSIAVENASAPDPASSAPRAQPTAIGPVEDLKVHPDGELPTETGVQRPAGRPMAFDRTRPSQTVAPDLAPVSRAGTPPAPTTAASPFPPLGAAPTGIALAALAARSVPLRAERFSTSASADATSGAPVLAPPHTPADLDGPVRWTQRPIQIDALTSGAVRLTPSPTHSAPAPEHSASSSSVPDALVQAEALAAPRTAASPEKAPIELATRTVSDSAEASQADAARSLEDGTEPMPVRHAPHSSSLETDAREPARPDPPTPAPVATSAPLQAPAAVAAALAVVADSLSGPADELANAESVPTAEMIDASALLHAPPDARFSESARPAAAPLPARLATSIWMERLAADADRVQVSLGEDGSVRLRTQRQPDGVTVHLQFSDPEMQALASVHADRLRDALETHFAEPVRLTLDDASSNGAGTNNAGSNDADAQRGGSHSPRTTSSTPSESAPDASSHTSTQAADGRREWVG